MDNTKKILETRKRSTTTSRDLWDGVAKGVDQFVSPQTICCTPYLFTSENDLGHLFIRLPQSQLFFIMCGVKLHLEYVK
jgi:hypothetical protein